MGEKIIIEDTTHYKFKKENFKDLTEGQIFMTTNGGLYIKSGYCDVFDNYATCLSDGCYISFSPYEEVYPVDCNITFRRILQEVSDND